MLFINSLLLLTISFSAYSKIVPFIPKYRLENLKAFVDSKNLYYFNNNRGEFVMSKGFKSYPIIKGQSKETQYNAFLSSDYNHLLVEEITDYLSHMNIRKMNKIWFTDVGSKKANFIGKGVNPQFHLNSTWISYFDPQNKSIIIINARTKEVYKKILIQDNRRPYFIPDVAVSSQLDIIFTQVNSQNEQEVIKLNKKDKSILLKGTIKHSDFSMCSSNGRIFIKEALLDSSIKKSSLSLFELQDSKANRIHRSKGHYVGPLLCLPGMLFYAEKKFNISKEKPIVQDLVLFKLKGQQAIIEKSFNGDISYFLNGDKVLINFDSKVYIYNE